MEPVIVEDYNRTYVLWQNHRMADICLISSDAVTKINFLEARSNSCWPHRGKQLQYFVWFIHSKDKCMPYVKNVFTIACFRNCHTKVNLLGQYLCVLQLWDSHGGQVNKILATSVFYIHILKGPYMSLLHVTNYGNAVPSIICSP
jgi:hypothetical protein